MADSETHRGHRIVLLVYAVVVAIAGLMGWLLGSIRPDDIEPELFFLVSLPPTPAGVALYGMVTVAVLLGIVLGLVVIVGNRYDERPR